MSPVDPALRWTYEAPSASTPQRRPGQPASKSSAIGPGGLIDRLEEMAKNATTRSPFTVVETDGATKEVLCVVKAPL
jgi:hypothetical protein